tara:strand:- start:4361 stop:4999 length:639 start_codon:yes stop_codon:yes gene_type:complete
MIRDFNSIKERREFVRNHLKKIGFGLYSIETEEAQILLELLKFHPSKSNFPVRFFEVLPNPINKKSFHINLVKEDGFKCGFSWSSCCRLERFKNEKRNYYNEFCTACRSSISEDTYNYFLNNENRFCMKCGNDENIEVDHIYPFKFIVDEFIKKNKIQLEEIKYKKDFIFRDSFRDLDLKERFYNFHKLKAEYQYLCKTCNLKKGCKIELVF